MEESLDRQCLTSSPTASRFSIASSSRNGFGCCGLNHVGESFLETRILPVPFACGLDVPARRSIPRPTSSRMARASRASNLFPRLARDTASCYPANSFAFSRTPRRSNLPVPKMWDLIDAIERILRRNPNRRQCRLYAEAVADFGLASFSVPCAGRSGVLPLRSSGTAVTATQIGSSSSWATTWLIVSSIRNVRNHFAADLREPAFAAGDENEAVFVDLPDVAADVPAVADDLGRFLLRQSQVALSSRSGRCSRACRFRPGPRSSPVSM